MLKIDNLHATVGGKPILNGLSLTVPAGDVHAIMGPNGAGKSTLAYVLGGRPGYEVTAGSVHFGAQDREVAPDRLDVESGAGHRGRGWCVHLIIQKCPRARAVRALP